jgi:acetyl esterase/lipase
MRMVNGKPNRLFYGSILMLTAFLSACTEIGFKALNTPSYLLSEQRATTDLAYGDLAHQKLDIYLPARAVDARKQLVIFVYGGGWTSGSKANYYFMADALTSLGYAVAIPDYIKYPQGRFPVFVEDVALAISWLSHNVGNYAEIDDFIIMGHSAGAHTGALLVTDPSYLAAHGYRARDIRAFVGLAGPYGFQPKDGKYRAIFANLEDYKQMQPLHFADGKEPPMLLLHGSKDSTVLPVNTRKFAEKVKAGGGTVDTNFYADTGHVDLVISLSRMFDADDTVRSDILDFLQRGT